MKPGKGGAFVRTKLKNVRTGAVIDRTFRADEKVEQAIIDKREMQFLYREGDDYVFMDNETYDQLHVAPDRARRRRRTTSRRATPPSCRCTSDEIVGVELPAAVELTVTETEPGMQGDRVSGARKPATLETGLVVQVPLFVEHGDRVKVDTRSGEYLTRRVSDPAISVERRREARERALALLYEAEAKGVSPSRGRWPGSRCRPTPSRPTSSAASGDTEAQIDELIARVARGLDRSSACRRSTARCCGSACYELLTRPDVPTAVVSTRRSSWPSRFSTEDSGRFVNGVLSKLAKEIRPG